MSEPSFRPLTAREALLEIRRLAEPPISRGPLKMETIRAIDAAASAGLDCTGLENFETADQLADRLAEAHKVLREVPKDWRRSRMGEVEGALALPPDLEAMVERRIGPP